MPLLRAGTVDLGYEDADLDRGRGGADRSARPRTSTVEEPELVTRELARFFADQARGTP